MPHLIIEVSENVDIQNPTQLLESINKQLFSSGEFSKAEDIKTRILRVENSLVGLNTSKNNEFVYANLKIMSGRSDDIKNKLAVDILDNLKEHLKSQIESMSIQLCVEVEELSATYHKVVL